MDNNIIDKSKTRNKTEKGDVLKKFYEDGFPDFHIGEIVKGRIVRSVANGAIIDLGLKSEGFLPLDEFSSADEIIEGKEISVLLESLENREGVPIISKKKADFRLAWTTFEEKLRLTEIIPARVIRKVKGGLIVSILSQEAFLPGSQIDVKPVFNFDAMIGQTFDVKILSLTREKNNVVVSRRAILEEKIKQARERVFSKVKVGDVLVGTVSSIADFGVFVDIDGVDALLHISDLSWEKVIHPKEVVNIGEALQVKVLALDPENFRITVGRKQLEKHPWEDVEKKYAIGTKVKGAVNSLAEYGAFVQLENNVDGLIHISEMSWTRSIHHPSQILKIGDEVEAIVLNIDRDNRRISLGLKQAIPDPWSVIEEQFQIGQKVEGRVTHLKPFGVFIEIEPGIEGLIRNQDLSWTKRVYHPKEIVKRNQTLEAIILDIDKENRQLALGYKQTKEDPFYRLSTEYKTGDVISGRIVELARLGVIVSLPHNIEEYVPRSQLVKGTPATELVQSEKCEVKMHSALGTGSSAPAKYQVGENIELKITYVDFELRKIGLSEKALFAVEVKEPTEEIRDSRIGPAKVKPRRSRRKAISEEERALEEELKAGGVKFTFEDHLDDDAKQLRGRRRK